MTKLDEIKQHYGEELHICADRTHAPFARDTNADFQWLLAEVERLTLADRQWADHVKRLSEDVGQHIQAGSIAQARVPRQGRGLQRADYERMWSALQAETTTSVRVRGELRAEVERLRAALTEITDLELEGDASLEDAMGIADLALNPPPLDGDKAS